ncbi:hypothetical protein [Paracidovorax konjaci]|uniref:Single-stranded DNA-binding protein n=1 Tax=Paracidovorax konjaci TaxID=32040 RepID=A0A1I1VVK7_9BURK|nr:hypothetical protein [Paracidovorax konjaci]SFD87126.1 hypothetical protein SAMN04489710_107235 [Paracidovorax konjaci]
MKFQTEVVVHGVKESEGTIEGRAYSSTTFHCEVDLSENSAGRSIGRATRPFKLGDAREYDKWAHLGASLPIKAMATFEMAAGAQDATKLKLVDIKPVERAASKAA